MGGPSPEHDISLATGSLIARHIDRSKYDVREVSIPKDAKWEVPNNIDVAFIAMHGEYGEDGTIQALLETVNVPYTGSGVAASALAMDKVKSAELFRARGMSVPDYLSVEYAEWKIVPYKTVGAVRRFGYPAIVKPVDCGSSVGVTVVQATAQLADALTTAFSFSPRVMIQKYISGHEVTCGILDEGGQTKPVALPPTQIIQRQAKFFDYSAKYTQGATEEITPPRLPLTTIQKIQETALAAHRALGCSGMSRTDMIVADDDIYVLETNTIPGMTATSLYPQAAAVAGIPFTQLLNKLIQEAITRKRHA